MNEIPFLPNRELWVRTVRERDNLAAQLARANIDIELAKATIEDAKRQHNAEVGRINAALANARFEIDANCAQLEKAEAERDAARADLIHVAEQWHASEKALDSARSEVARVTELAIFERDSAAREIERLTAALEEMLDWIQKSESIAMPSDKDMFGVLRDMARAALGGDTARADLIHVAERWHGSEKNLEAARAEVARLMTVVGYIESELQVRLCTGGFWDVMHDVHLGRGGLVELCLVAAQGGDTAQTLTQEQVTETLVQLQDRWR